jgi:hypothetical protein
MDDDDDRLISPIEWQGKMPPPRPLDLRIGLAMHWTMCKADCETTDQQRQRLKSYGRKRQGIARILQRELGHVGLKLVWQDGSEINPDLFKAEHNRRG